MRFSYLLFSLLAVGCGRVASEERPRLEIALFEEARALTSRGGATDVLCVGLRQEGRDSSELASLLMDPDSGVLNALRARHSGVAAFSACEIVNLPDRFGPSVRTRASGERAMLIWVREVPRYAKHARIGYFTSGLAAGEWLCRVQRSSGAWQVSDCVQEWVS
jgi:hypothetical protein